MSVGAWTYGSTEATVEALATLCPCGHLGNDHLWQKILNPDDHWTQQVHRHVFGRCRGCTNCARGLPMPHRFMPCPCDGEDHNR